MSTNGKGSSRRGTDPESLRRYHEGWESIFGSKGKSLSKGKSTAKRGQVTRKRIMANTWDTRPGKRPIYETQDYPALVCYDCATNAGGRLLDPDGTTYQADLCGVCAEVRWVTTPGDYGYPRF